ncbi:MAG TPA: serine/threonine-protein kinase [Geodermatophilus sp.]|nr:serine/threonine-protein kinase [Geodermatophilus sp.]
MVDLEQFGAYRIEALLGRGGMGEVYRAYDTEHDRVVALKVLSEHLAADQGYRERFRREAHLAARLNEPHIVPIHRYGEIDGRLFLDMRLVPGRDVAAVLAEEGPMSPARAVSIVSQTARALDSAHADGLVHRDVKPSNILLSGSGDDEFVYLVDFGIARSTTDASGPALTQTGAALGSFDYMAPERFLEKPIDRRVDVYALACVLFECLTARRPFTGDGLATLMYAHLNTEPQPPSAVRPGLPAGLDEVVLKGLAKDPDERYGSCGELAAAARAALQESGVAVVPEVVAPTAPPTSITPLPFAPQTVGFSNPGPPAGVAGGYGPPSNPGPPAGYGPPSNPGGYGPPSNPGGPTYAPQSNPGPPGGYEPPSNPGGYGPPSNPGGPTYAPQGPGGTTGFGPPGVGGVGSSPGGRKPNRLPLILAAAAVVAVLVVVGVIALAGGGGGEQPSGPTASDTPTSASPSTSTTSTPPPEPTPEEELLAIIPGDFQAEDCTGRQPAGDGDLAAVDCAPAQSEPAITTARFFLYEDGVAVDRVFVSDVTGVGLTELASGQQCPANQGYGYYQIGGERAGRVACWVDPEDNSANLLWTQDEFGAEGLVSIADGGAEGLTTLWDWWSVPAYSDFG